jgi:phosphatidyl-myo-inositol alpha-mannosyltransferase
MPLRVALTHAFCWPEVRRGGERYLHELASALSRRGHHVTVVAGASRPGFDSRDGMRVVRLPRRTFGDVTKTERRFGWTVLPALLAGRFDVVHSLGSRDAVASLSAARFHPKRRTIYTCLGLPLRQSWERRPDGVAHQRVVDDIDVYGCLSDFAKRCLHEDFGRAGAITPGGVNLTRFRPAPKRTEVPTLLYSGALDEPRKGVALLLEAIAILARTEPRVRLWLSGPGDPHRMLEAAPAAARERTELLPLGTPEDQPARYGRAWATVLPARFEAFGLAIVESFACGTPVVVGDHAGLPELVAPGVGVLVAPDDPASLASALAEVLAFSARPDTVDRCLEQARRHDWDGAVAPAIEALYLGAGRDEAYVA